MIKKIVPTLFLCSGLLCSCATMFGQYEMPPNNVTSMAVGNAAINICLANDLWQQKSIAYEYSTVASQMLEVAVCDENLYKREYQWMLDEAKRMTTSELQFFCRTMEQGMPEQTARIRRNYGRASQARAQETAAIAAMVSSSNNFVNSTQYASPNFQPNWPNVQFAPQQPQTDLYLINTNSGLKQCRVTSKGYVFCM